MRDIQLQLGERGGVNVHHVARFVISAAEMAAQRWIEAEMIKGVICGEERVARS